LLCGFRFSEPVGPKGKVPHHVSKTVSPAPNSPNMSQMRGNIEKTCHVNKMEIEVFSPLFKLSVLIIRRTRFAKYPLAAEISPFSSTFFSIALLVFGDCPKRTEYLQFLSAMFLSHQSLPAYPSVNPSSLLSKKNFRALSPVNPTTGCFPRKKLKFPDGA